MQLVAFTLLVVAGFIFVQRWRITNILSLKDGNSLYFASIVAAIPIFLVASQVLMALDDGTRLALTSKLLRYFGDSIKGDETGQAWLLLVSLVAIPLAAILAEGANVPLLANSRLLRYLYELIGDSEPLDLVLAEAAHNELPILVSLRSGKVYLGYSLVSELFGGSGTQWLHLAPWLSGYRDELKRLRFTTAYSPVAWRVNEEKLLHDPRFQVAIPLSSVDSVTPFDMELYITHFSVGSEQSQRNPDSGIEAPELAQPQIDWKSPARSDCIFYFFGFSLVLMWACNLLESFWIAFPAAFFGIALLIVSAQPSMGQNSA